MRPERRLQSGGSGGKMCLNFGCIWKTELGRLGDGTWV